jgi:hypothetical protein
LDGIRRRLEAASPQPWTLAFDVDGSRYIQTSREGDESRLFVKRDLDPASDADLEFIALARNALPRLVQAVGSGQTDLVTPAELDAYEHAAARATVGPWTPFIEEREPIGGSSVIWAGGDDDPDMYLWLGNTIAPAADIEFVAHARQDVPDLAAELRRRRAEAR